MRTNFSRGRRSTIISTSHQTTPSTLILYISEGHKRRRHSNMSTNVDMKLLKQTKFPPEFNQKVDMKKVNLEVMKK